MVGVFQNCTSLTSVTFNTRSTSSCNNIGSYAFSGCTALKSIELSDSLALIKEGAFYGCTALEVVDFTNLWNIQIPSIESYAFYNCSSLYSLEIYQAIDGDYFVCQAMDIAYDAFIGCDRLISEDGFGLLYIRSSYGSYVNDFFVFVGFFEDMGYYEVNQDCKIIAGYGNSQITMFEDFLGDIFFDIVLPYGVFAISEGAFYNTHLGSINIPFSVAYICKNALYYNVDQVGYSMINTEPTYWELGSLDEDGELVCENDVDLGSVFQEEWAEYFVVYCDYIWVQYSAFKWTDYWGPCWVIVPII